MTKVELKKSIIAKIEQKVLAGEPIPSPFTDAVKSKLFKGIVRKVKANVKKTQQAKAHIQADERLDFAVAKIAQALEGRGVKIKNKVQIKELKKTLTEVFGEGIDVNNFPEFPKSFEVVQTEKPAWYVEPKEAPDEVSIKALPAVEIKGVVKADATEGFAQVMVAFLTELVQFLTKLAKNTFRVALGKEHYVTPQMVFLVDPHKNFKPIKLEDMGIGTVNQTIQQSYSRGPSELSIRGANSVDDNTLAVTTAGTRVQLPNQACSRVLIQAHPNNTGDIVVGGANVVAASGTRRGLALYGSQWQEFFVSNLNKLYIDATQNGDKINYIFEYNS